MSIKKATQFNRIFDPEFLQARKDITPVQLACAQGKIDEVIAGVKADEECMFKKNRDGNTMLLIAVANGNVKIASLLMEMKSNVMVKNLQKMDAVDYAVMDGVRTPMAKCVLSNCEFIVPEVLEGPFWKASKQVLIDLAATGHKMARSGIIGKRPDFSNLFGQETDYRKEWVSQFKYIASIVKRGVLLLSDDIEYLERDALLTGALEIPFASRYLYSPATKTVRQFAKCLRGKYEEDIEKRLVETSLSGDAMSVQGLLKAKASPDIENVKGETVLQCACGNGDPQTIKCLLVAKARVNDRNKDGYSALHIASSRNKYEAVSVLLKAKADLFTRTNKGHSALDFVKHEGHKEVLELIQSERQTRKEASAMAKGTL